MSDNFFKFERKGIDFPFYKSNPKLNKLDWILLLMSVLVFFFYSQLPTTPFISWICFLLPMVIILVIIRFKLSLIFKKLTKKDIPLIFKLTILSLCVSIILLILISLWINFAPDENALDVPVGLSIPYLLEIIQLPIVLIDEELFKFSIFILVLALVYKLSDNRKMGVVCASFVTMIFFGACHLNGHGGLLRLIKCIILQGFGSICDVYSYVKTKNVLISYFIHLFYDLSLSLLFLF